MSGSVLATGHDRDRHLPGVAPAGEVDADAFDERTHRDHVHELARRGDRAARGSGHARDDRVVARPADERPRQLRHAEGHEPEHPPVLGPGMLQLWICRLQLGTRRVGAANDCHGADAPGSATSVANVTYHDATRLPHASFLVGLANRHRHRRRERLAGSSPSCVEVAAQCAGRHREHHVVHARVERVAHALDGSKVEGLVREPAMRREGFDRSACAGPRTAPTPTAPCASCVGAAASRRGARCAVAAWEAPRASAARR